MPRYIHSYLYFLIYHCFPCASWGRGKNNDQKDKQWPTKHYTETKSNTNPTDNQGYTWVLRKGRFLLLRVCNSSLYHRLQSWWKNAMCLIVEVFGSTTHSSLQVVSVPSCNNVAPVTNLCLGRVTTRSHSSQWSKTHYLRFKHFIITITDDPSPC
jgi:hypothetical protein